MEGRSNAEIAVRPDCIEKTVESKLRRSRHIWAEEVSP
jgi:hypothetical protein